MQITKLMSVKAAWESFSFPIKAGTPVNIHGALSNSAAAIGIVPQPIKVKPYDENIYIMTGGSVDAAEIDFPSLSTAAMQNMNGITFYGTDGDPEVHPVYEIPEPEALYKLVSISDFDTMTEAQKKALAVECLELLSKGGVVDMLNSSVYIRATDYSIAKSAAGEITGGTITGQIIFNSTLVSAKVTHNGTTVTPSISYYTLTPQT